MSVQASISCVLLFRVFICDGVTVNSVVRIMTKNMSGSVGLELFKTRNFSKVSTTTSFIQLGNIGTTSFVHFVCLFRGQNRAATNDNIPTLLGPVFNVLQNPGPGMEANKTDRTCCTMYILIQRVFNTMSKKFMNINKV